MELTYDNMKQWVVDYYKALSSISGEADKAKISAMLAPDYKVHPSGPARILDREQWASELCSNTEYQLKISYDAYHPLGINIDEKRGWGSAVILEEYLDPKTKKEVKPNKNMFTFFKFCIHDGKVKAKNELIIGVTGSLKGAW
jgi:hypothetical protein